MSYIEFFSRTFLFADIPINELSVLLEGKIYEKNFEKSEVIYSPKKHSEMIGFIFSGECEVQSADGTVPLNSLKVGDSFGILTVLSDGDVFPTTVYAKRQTTVCFIKSTDLKAMYKSNAQLTQNIMDFLVSRINFLNAKISTFSADCVEKKLARHLILKSNGNKRLTLNLKHTAEALSIGRASLYRALTLLEDKGLIVREEKCIIILNPEGLKEI